MPVKGVLLPTSEEMQKARHGTIYHKIHIIGGSVGGQKWSLSRGLNKNLFVDIGGRCVRYSVEDLVRDAHDIVKKVK